MRAKRKRQPARPARGWPKAPSDYSLDAFDLFELVTEWHGLRFRERASCFQAWRAQRERHLEEVAHALAG